MATSRVIGKKARPRAPARFGARLKPEAKELLERAAALTGRSLTDFVLTSAEEAALRTIREHELVRLTARDSKAFVAALLENTKPNKRLRKAAVRYKATSSVKV
jgi:uncharacterized protein (DUF1778 family)